MADHKWADVAHYYQFSGIDLEIGVGTRPFRGVARTSDVGSLPKRGLFLDIKGNYTRTTSESLDQYRPILRHLEDMTEGEARELIQIFLQSNKYDPIDDSELWFEIHRWDNAALLDGDIAIHFSISARCWEGELAICLNGDFQSSDEETGEIYRVTNQMKMVHWLISKGFDVFGLIESGQAIRKGVGE